MKTILYGEEKGSKSALSEYLHLISIKMLCDLCPILLSLTLFVIWKLKSINVVLKIGLCDACIHRFVGS